MTSAKSIGILSKYILCHGIFRIKMKYQYPPTLLFALLVLIMFEVGSLSDASWIKKNVAISSKTLVL